jgi:DNA-binding winged helix-turn-helix (wHTH) protein/TolB-like protein
MVYHFGVFEFDAAGEGLRKNGRAASLEPQPARALALLLARAGEVVSREELRHAVWGGDTHVDFERGIAYCVSQVRTALGDSGENPRFVQTVPKQGFRFIAPVALVEGATGSKGPKGPKGPKGGVLVVGAVVALAVLAAGAFLLIRAVQPPVRAIVAVSVFDNETGLAEHDRLVAGLSDLVVERLTKLDPDRVAVVGNAAVLRQPRNIRNLQAIADNVTADYVLLGQLQRGETGLRFITHFIRLQDEAHLRANRLVMPDAGVAGLEAAVVEEFERAVREHVLNAGAN